MSCSSPPLTSTIDDLFHMLQQYNAEHNPIELELEELSITGSPNVSNASGRYKYEVLDSAGTVYDSGDWKPNLILNCGLDKISDMSWAQVFQFAVAGCDPTPTKESWEDTGLYVEILSSQKCPAVEFSGSVCYNSVSPGGIVARATASSREAPDAAPAGNCLQRTFGESSDSGKLLYLRDRDLQYNVLTSCPVYQVDPVLPDILLYADATGGLIDPGAVTSGSGYIGPLSADSGLPLAHGLIDVEMQNIDLSAGDCTLPLLCAYPDTHPLSGTAKYINPGSGISVDPPQMYSPQIQVVVDNVNGCSLSAAKINILDAGDGMPDGTLPVSFTPTPRGGGCKQVSTGSAIMSAAQGFATIVGSKVTGITVPTALSGMGYSPGEILTANVALPAPRQAVVQAKTHSYTGAVTAVEIIDPGMGYSSTTPARICFPQIPDPVIVSYDLLLDPVETYETVNNGHYHERITLPSPEQKADIFNTNQTYLFDQYKTHAWYLTGRHPETNATYCGTDFLSAGNQMALTRTFDFYMELQPVTYTEIGFKESPAARELFSRIALEDPIYLCPGQFLRLTYQLLITFEPGDVPRYKEVISDGTWYNGTRTDGTRVLSGYECMQGNGMCVIGDDGVANPYDITGLANEPFAPGSTNLGPQYGFVNRWKNGDTRLSHPTKEYNNDADNPWILGGDQVSPPDWAAKHWDSPTVNYMPRDFKTFIEWPSQTMSVPDPANTTATIKWNSIDIPAGPELTLERDAFDHWFTKAPPSAQNTITFTNFAANNAAGAGRWDFLITKGYLTDVYPQLLSSNTVYQDIKDTQWINTYREGEFIPSTPYARSQPGVFMGPVIPYTGRDGALHDPVSVLGSRLSRNVSALIHPYGGHYLVMLDPANTGLGKYGQVTVTYPICPSGTLTYTSPDFCYRQIPPLDKNMVDTDYAWLEERQNYYGFGSTKVSDVYPVDPKAGGGPFTRLDSWSPWTHTPLITSYDLAAIKGPDRLKLRPDTAGNWSQAEAIPVAGSSAWISTNNEDFVPVGSYTNRSHTLFGAVCGQPGVDNQFDAARESTRSFETPCYFIEKYVRGSGKRIKRAVFETSFANLTGVKCLGLGPTSTTLLPVDMTDAPRFNTYMFKFGEVNTPVNYKGFDNLSTYKLTLDFKYVWYRNLKI